LHNWGDGIWDYPFKWTKHKIIEWISSTNKVTKLTGWLVNSYESASLLTVYSLINSFSFRLEVDSVDSYKLTSLRLSHRVRWRGGNDQNIVVHIRIFSPIKSPKTPNRKFEPIERSKLKSETLIKKQEKIETWKHIAIASLSHRHHVAIALDSSNIADAVVVTLLLLSLVQFLTFSHSHYLTFL